MSTSATRRRPNILITGTPGTGKSTLAERLAQELGFTFIDIGQEIQSRGFYIEFDEAYNSHVLDEDKLLDFLEESLGADDGGVVIDYHSSDFFPKRWFDLIIVLRCENTQIFYDRLAARGYAERKLRDNMECEIFGTVAEEALDAYDEERVHQLRSETLADLADNVRKVSQLVAQLNEQKKANKR